LSDYRFDFTLADQVLDEMHAVNFRVRQALVDVQARVEARLQDWRVDALEEYWQAKAEWQQRAGQMPIHVEAGRRTLLTISGDFGDTEQLASQIWENTRG
jgi:uncharacterized protein YukE